MSIDPVFPLPEPDFLWVHDLAYRDDSAASLVVDEERKWTYADTPAVTFTGYLTAPNPRDVDRADSTGVILDAVCLAPHGIGIDDNDVVVADSSSGVADYLQGSYRVGVVRPNPSHLRILLSRIKGDPQPTRDPGWNSDAIITPATIDTGF